MDSGVRGNDGGGDQGTPGPVAAIVYGTGVIPLATMLKVGFVLNVLGACLIWIMLYLLCPLLGFV